jgi:hypothetical protein
MWIKRSKINLWIAAFFCPLACFANGFPADNQAPQVRNVSAKPDYAKKTLAISYDLTDKENDSISVRVVLMDAGNTVIAQEGVELTGDVGFPVFAKTKKKALLRFKDPQFLRSVHTVKIMASDPHRPSLQRLLGDFDSVRLLRNLLMVGKERNIYSKASQAQLEAVRLAISENFTRAGITPRKQSFQVSNVNGENIIGELRSSRPGAKTLVIGAHYDAVKGSPGFDDNATGVAALMEIATILSKYDFGYHIKFVAFDLEETLENVPGAKGVEGSAAFVNKGGIDKEEKIAGFINLDMLGYYSQESNSQFFPEELKAVFPDIYDRIEKDKFRGNFLLVISNVASAALYNTLKAVGSQYLPSLNIVNVAVPGNGEYMPDFRRSDHANFWDKGYSAISLGDGAFSRNPHYHTPEDTFKDINPGFFSSVTRLLLLTVAAHSDMMNASVAVAKVGSR